MNIDHLREFTFLADTLNFSITARHFFLSQSVLSKHISAMEDELHTKLLERNSHSVCLTEQGKLFKKDANAIVDRYDNAIIRLRGVEEGYVSTLDIQYLRGASRPFMDKFLEKVRQQLPNTQIKLRCVEFWELNLALDARNPDIVFAMDFFPEAHDLYNVTPIYKDKFDAITRPGHPIHKEVIDGYLDISALEGKKLLMPDESAYGNMASFVENFVPFTQENTYHYSDIETCITHLLLEGYIGFSSEHNISIYGDKIDFIPLTNVDTSYNVSAFISKEKDRPELDICRSIVEDIVKYMKGKKPFARIDK